MLPFLLKFTSELYDFTSDYCQFKRQFLQFGKHRKSFLLREIAFQSDLSLVVIHPDAAKLPVQSRQFFDSNQARNGRLLSLERSH